MRRELDSDRRLAALATRQHGIVSRTELGALGFSPSAVDRRMRSGRLHQLHRGVYAVGHLSLTPRARWLAAVKACGRGAVLSHAAAGSLWELRASAARLVDVTVPTAAGLIAPSGVRLHRHAHLRPEEATTREGIPVTTVARTLLDLAATLPRRALERACDQAEVLCLYDERAVRAALEGRSGRPGVPALTALLAEHEIGTTLTDSPLEDRFLGLCAEHRLPRPRVNARVAGLRVDFHWPAAKLVVETDGWTYHRTRGAFERDRERDATLAARGVRVLRFTRRQIRTDPQSVVRALRRSLST